MRAVLASLAVCLVSGCAMEPVDRIVRVTVPAPVVAMADDFAVPVLMYHRINTLTPREERSPLMRDLTVSPSAFEEQIRTLKQEGFTFLLASQVEDAVRNHKPLPVKAVAITL